LTSWPQRLSGGQRTGSATSLQPPGGAPNTRRWKPSFAHASRDGRPAH